jgi:ParB family chromosome partitioning protein
MAEIHQLIHSSESKEWYTPRRYIEAVRLVMGGIDLDPASCAEANTIVNATQYHDLSKNGLSLNWYGRVFLNPPYGKTKNKSNQEIWSAYLLEQYRQRNVTEAILLVNAVTDRRWFQKLWAYPVCFTNHRIKFISPNGKFNQPTHGNCFVYLGGQGQKFTEVFSKFGVIAMAKAA